MISATMIIIKMQVLQVSVLCADGTVIIKSGRLNASVAQVHATALNETGIELFLSNM